MAVLVLTLLSIVGVVRSVRSDVSVLFLIFGIVGAEVLMEISEVPLGTFITEHGETRLYDSSIEIAIVKSHPSVIRDRLCQRIIAHVSGILQTLSDKTNSNSTDLDLIVLYKRRLNNVKRSAIRQRRWAPLEPLGSAVGSLFGLASKKDMEETRDRINDVIDNMRGQYKMVKGLTVALNETIHNQAEIQISVQTLVERARNVERTVRGLHRDVDALMRNNILMNTYLLIESSLSMLEHFKAKEDIYHQQFQLTRDLAEIGHVTEDLIKSEKLESLLQSVGSPLTPLYVYKNFPVHLLELSREEVAYIFSIPILNPEKFTA
jgi:hypothetical protein